MPALRLQDNSQGAHAIQEEGKGEVIIMKNTDKGNAPFITKKDGYAFTGIVLTLFGLFSLLGGWFPAGSGNANGFYRDENFTAWLIATLIVLVLGIYSLYKVKKYAEVKKK